MAGTELQAARVREVLLRERRRESEESEFGRSRTTTPLRVRGSDLAKVRRRPTQRGN